MGSYPPSGLRDYMSQFHITTWIWQKVPFLEADSVGSYTPSGLRTQEHSVQISYYHMNLSQSPTIGGRFYGKLSPPRTQDSRTPCPKLILPYKIFTKSHFWRQLLWIAIPQKDSGLRDSMSKVHITTWNCHKVPLLEAGSIGSYPPSGFRTQDSENPCLDFILPYKVGIKSNFWRQLL